MPCCLTKEPVLSEVFIMPEVGGVNQVLGVVSPQQALEGGEVTVVLVLNVDAAPGIFPRPHSSPIAEGGEGVGGHHGKRRSVILTTQSVLFMLDVVEAVQLNPVVSHLSPHLYHSIM